MCIIIDVEGYKEPYRSPSQIPSIYRWGNWGLEQQVQPMVTTTSKDVAHGGANIFHRQGQYLHQDSQLSQAFRTIRNGTKPPYK